MLTAGHSKFAGGHLQVILMTFQEAQIFPYTLSLQGHSSVPTDAKQNEGESEQLGADFKPEQTSHGCTSVGEKALVCW